jgi:ectoine hydroxylase-related dioxygenase (phytanoyl-CoA dioxygenase family)
MWKKNWAQTQKRFVDWWEHRGLLIGMWGAPDTGRSVNEAVASPGSPGSLQERYCRASFRAAENHYRLSRSVFPLDVLPMAITDLGPGSLALLLGAKPEFAEDTVWFHPCMEQEPEPEKLPVLRFDTGHPWWRITEAIVRGCVDLSRGKYLVGFPDLIENVDVLCSLRGAQMLCLDFIDRPDWVEQKILEINEVWFSAYSRLYDLIKLEDGSSAFGAFYLWGPGKVAKVQCDSSVMFSPEMYQRFVLPALTAQCEWLDHSMYHVDGTQALRHLETLLVIEALDAIEWTAVTRAGMICIAASWRRENPCRSSASSPRKSGPYSTPSGRRVFTCSSNSRRNAKPIKYWSKSALIDLMIAMKPVTETQRELYHREGYLILPGVIPAETLTTLREECSYYLGYYDALMDAKGIQTEGITHRGKRYFINNRYRLSHRLWHFIFSPLMAEVALATVGPDACLFHEQWVVKGAEQGMKFSWHQDSGYVKWYDPTTRHRPYVTCWCTLDEVSEVNGTVYLLPHSRAGTKDKLIDHHQEEGSNDLIGYTGGDPGDPVIVPAGSIVAFDSYVFHRSGPNTTHRMRRVYLPQYSAGPINRPDGKPWAMATPFLSGGEIVYRHADDTAEKYGPFPEQK